MHKETNLDPKYKISVDSFEEIPNGTLVCSCVTPGLGEEGHLDITISFSDFKAHLGDKIWFTHSGDSQDGEQVSFDYWYAENKHSLEMLDELSDYINAKEGRKQLADMPDVLPALQSILNSYKKTA